MGYIHLYYGDGKGKTTAALGLALRAAGAGMRVWIVQFLKGIPTSETASLQQIPNITLLRCDQNYGYTPGMDAATREAVRANHNRNLAAALAQVQEGACELLVLDEICDAYACGLVDAALLEPLLRQKPESLELVLTGHTPDPIFLDCADYISEIKKIRHPYDRGIPARKGIEW